MSPARVVRKARRSSPPRRSMNPPRAFICIISAADPPPSVEGDLHLPQPGEFDGDMVPRLDVHGLQTGAGDDNLAGLDPAAALGALVDEPGQCNARVAQG